MKNFILFIMSFLILMTVHCQSIEKNLLIIQSNKKNTITNLRKKDITNSESRVFDLIINSNKCNRQLKAVNSIQLKMDSLIVTDYNEFSNLQDTSYND